LLLANGVQRSEHRHQRRIARTWLEYQRGVCNANLAQLIQSTGSVLLVGDAAMAQDRNLVVIRRSRSQN
jgi:hypothetical protein